MKKWPFKTYQVGGSVRDEYLGRTVNDIDWLVVGAAHDQMIELGFKQVGKDFPVYLHPHNKQEYALARTERKSGNGYSGFEVCSDPTITIEQDLSRRDLTINAIAKDPVDGEITDPFGGIKDIQDRVLRHVSSAFSEDPLRVLRVARFLAQLADMGFVIADETMALMTQISLSGELQYLAPERIWIETQKGLDTKKPSVYFDVLRQCKALKVLFPEIDDLFGVPQRADYHPEIDSGIHTMMVLDRCAQLTTNLDARFCALTHDLGKALTPEDILPRHIGHEKRGLAPLKKLCEHYHTPKQTYQIAKTFCEFHTHLHTIHILKPSTILRLMEKLKYAHDNHWVDLFAICGEADAQGRLSFENKPYPQKTWLKTIHQNLLLLNFKDVSKNTAVDKIKHTIEAMKLDSIAQSCAQLKRECPIESDC